MSSKLFDLRGKTVMITGAAGGIGSAMSRALGQEGASLVLADLAGEALDGLVAELAATGGKVAALALRVEDRQACTAAVAQAVSEFGGIDVLINCAGVNTRMRPECYEEAVWDRIVDINLKGSFNMSQAVYPVMKAQGRGKIINIGSILALASNAVTAAYSASKGGVLQMTRSLACAWAADGITVNVIQPGWIDTALSRQARVDIPGHAERVVATTPLGRWGEPEDLIGATIFLAAAASDFVTGASLVVDGGVTAHI
ncbi:SDR family NAD(P)-dependent oxidoreductase [Bordetella genomosp. 12]|uniref:2-deoxy-D-gluconate 3-dehydrogenase n=1 Tax=Bordetella genomosp. 12 TaxID=463035 RepID=A0A261VA15_9BORD|nr:SDR family NAD(P)-dependent oxidoreductase [Bordetella genomosp. 12]OZI70815.1 2-deoxy-D-gluconate 3-dehydrogenase [Bordetella genomosp. 12]